MRPAILPALTLLVATSLPAQTGAGRGGDSFRVAIAVEAGGVLGGPSGGLVAQLNAAGFGGQYPCTFLCGDRTVLTYPRKGGSGPLFGISARYWIRPTVAVGAGYSAALLGGSTGYAGGEGYVISDWESKSAWLGVSWKPAPLLRIGGGPALHLLREPWIGPGAPASITRPGLMGELAIENHPSKRVFLSLGTRYHLIPTTDVPTRFHARDEHAVTLRPPWGHLTVSLSVGLRM